MKVYEALAHTFKKLDLGTCFALLGDANMHWAGALSDLGAEFVYTRHEHAALAAATAYARNSGKIGLASVTCGPGLTQIITMLPIAVRAKVPVVLFAGEPPKRQAWYNQTIDQASLVKTCGADYVPLHNIKTIVEELLASVGRATKDGRPVVIGVPLDLQKEEFSGNLPDINPKFYIRPLPVLQPDDSVIRQLGQIISKFKKSVIIAGLGACSKPTQALIRELGEITGSLLATTLPAKGLFNDQEFCLGVAGGYSSDTAKRIFEEAELVIGIGARMSYHTFDAGRLTPRAIRVQIDLEPRTHVEGRRSADFLIKADAESALKALITHLVKKPQKSWRSDAMKAGIRKANQLPAHKIKVNGFLHPLAVIDTLQNCIPKFCHIINTSGHCAYYTAQMNLHPQSHFTVIRDFGAIGNGTSFAIGIAKLYPDRPIVLLDGDGSVMMHIQELETISRHDLNILILVLNDGAYGSEVHKLRKTGSSLKGSIFGRPDFNAIGKSFGLIGTTAKTTGDIENAIQNFLKYRGSSICDIHISGSVCSPQI